MFLGAGSAATGIADLMTAAFVDEGLSVDEARRHLWFVDVNGLVVKARTDLMAHNLPYAHDHPPLRLPRRDRGHQAARADRRHRRAGHVHAGGDRAHERASTSGRSIFALSNPTSKAECTAEQAYTWSRGRAIFASGSPFAPGRPTAGSVPPGTGQQRLRVPRHRPGRGGLPARTLPDELFLAAARTLAGLVRRRTSTRASLYPPLQEHPQDLARHRRQRRRDSLRASARPREASSPPPGRHRAFHVRAVGAQRPTSAGGRRSPPTPASRRRPSGCRS